MPITAPHTFTSVIGQVQTRLQASVSASAMSGIVSTTRVFTSFATDEVIASWSMDDKFIVVRPKSFPPDRGCQAGGGTATLKIDGQLMVSIWVRLAIDQETHDDSWLTDSTLGIGPLIDAATVSLEQYMPVDSSGNYYFIQPLRLLSPGWVFPPKQIGTWGAIQSTWSLCYWMTAS